MFKLTFTDELGCAFILTFADYKAVLTEIKKWLKANDSGETPLYKIELEVCE